MLTVVGMFLHCNENAADTAEFPFVAVGGLLTTDEVKLNGY